MRRFLDLARDLLQQRPELPHTDGPLQGIEKFRLLGDLIRREFRHGRNPIAPVAVLFVGVFLYVQGRQTGEKLLQAVAVVALSGGRLRNLLCTCSR